MRAFNPEKLQYKLDDDGGWIADGWDPSDINLVIDQFAGCAVCAGVVRNVREYKAAHIAWHLRIEPDADIT